MRLERRSGFLFRGPVNFQGANLQCQTSGGVSFSHDLFDVENALRTHHPHTFGLPASLEDDDLGTACEGVRSLGKMTDMQLQPRKGPHL